MLSQNRSLLNLQSSLQRLCDFFSVGKLLKSSNIVKRDDVPGVSVTALFMTALLSCFVPGTGTVYGALKSRLTDVGVSHKNALYNFLGSSRNNWRRLNLLLASKIIAIIRGWSDPDRRFCFVVDDSMLERPKGKAVELLSWQFDHVTKRCIRAFSCLQLGWTDGVSYIPVASALMTSRKAKNRFSGILGEINKRCCGYRRRKEAMRAKPQVVVSLLKQALNRGIYAGYVLFNSWFTCEPLILHILGLELDVIGMLKDTRQTYLYQGRWRAFRTPWPLRRSCSALRNCLRNCRTPVSLRTAALPLSSRS